METKSTGSQLHVHAVKHPHSNLHCLPAGLDESLLLLNVFCYLDGYQICKVASVCKEWKAFAADSAVWRECCAHVWGDGEHLDRFVSKYARDFKRMFRERPHLRYDGVYLLETEYYRTVERDLRSPYAKSIRTAYYRYLHFRPKGVVYYALVNESEKPSLRRPFDMTDKRLRKGVYKANSSQAVIKVDVGHLMLLMRLELSETRKGAHNRLYMIEFRGKSNEEDEPIMFPLPESDFDFTRERE